MPKQVDHEARRREISEAVGRLASTRGLSGVTFREVAGEAGVSVALVQHYFGTKENLLIATVNLLSLDVAERIRGRVDALPVDAPALQRVRAIAAAFLPTDGPSEAAMRQYLGFAGAALTDAGLRRADAFGNASRLVDVLADQLALGQEAGEVAPELDVRAQAHLLLSLILGLSLTTLLQADGRDQVDLGDAAADPLDLLDAHLRALRA